MLWPVFWQRRREGLEFIWPTKFHDDGFTIASNFIYFVKRYSFKVQTALVYAQSFYLRCPIYAIKQWSFIICEHIFGVLISSHITRETCTVKIKRGWWNGHLNWIWYLPFFRLFLWKVLEVELEDSTEQTIWKDLCEKAVALPLEMLRYRLQI